MQDLLSLLTSLAWPLAIALAWLAGEFGQRWTGLPRISFYGLVGFALGSAMNMLSAIGAYAAISRELGVPLVWPGAGARRTSRTK